MAIVFDAPLSPDAQTAYIREVPISRGNPLLGQGVRLRVSCPSFSLL